MLMSETSRAVQLMCASRGNAANHHVPYRNIIRSTSDFYATSVSVFCSTEESQLERLHGEMVSQSEVRVP